MSVRLMGLVWYLEIPSTEKLVLLALADNANDEGSCWPSMATIEAKTSLSNRTIRYAVKRLEEGGYLVTKNRNGHSLNYTLTPAPDAARHVMPVAPDAGVPRHQMPTPGTRCRGPRHQMPT